jgi:hypothetical protein
MMLETATRNNTLDTPMDLNVRQPARTGYLRMVIAITHVMLNHVNMTTAIATTVSQGAQSPGLGMVLAKKHVITLLVFSTAVTVITPKQVSAMKVAYGATLQIVSVIQNVWIRSVSMTSLHVCFVRQGVQTMLARIGSVTQNATIVYVATIRVNVKMNRSALQTAVLAQLETMSVILSAITSTATMTLATAKLKMNVHLAVSSSCEEMARVSQNAKTKTVSMTSSTVRKQPEKQNVLPAVQLRESAMAIVMDLALSKPVTMIMVIVTGDKSIVHLIANGQHLETRFAKKTVMLIHVSLTQGTVSC